MPKEKKERKGAYKQVWLTQEAIDLIDEIATEEGRSFAIQAGKLINSGLATYPMVTE